ncbi:uncharacterized protein LOC119668854 [Teleopsis dalmanni]|uniref:uncharacterized protein LOC119668854 n=1 Tax=Teleopsis dalmanni TaxID=139649 RepID=UPI0018CE46EC|nr:uncharacterized protein LOC119668854 [Teleopsis dalmanni]
MLNKRVYRILCIVAILNVVLVSILIINNSIIIIEENIIPEKLLLDSRKAPNETQMYASIAKELPSLHLQFLQKKAGSGRLNATCAEYPHLFDIQFHNTYYQSYDNGNSSFKIFGAYYDKRTTIEHTPMVRVLSMINRYENYTLNYCQLWYEERTQPVIVPVKEYKMIWYKEWGASPHHLYPHLISCFIPDDVKQLVPQTVSLVANECDLATNNVKVVFEDLQDNETQGNFTICVKNSYFPHEDMSARLVEWLELMRIMGAEKIFLYNMQLHPNMSKVLNYYEETGLVRLSPFTFARGEPNLRNMQHEVNKANYLNTILNELLPFNDCLYRTIYKYKFVAVIDVDEVIMPLGNLTNWHQLVKVIEAEKDKNCEHFASYCFQNVYYPRYPDSPPYSLEVPEYFYMLQHVKRVADHLSIGLATKCLHNTKHVVALHNHYAIHYEQCCFANNINYTIGQMQHYREPDIMETLNDPVEDANIWRFKTELISNSAHVLKQLGFFP